MNRRMTLSLSAVFGLTIDKSGLSLPSTLLSSDKSTRLEAGMFGAEGLNKFYPGLNMEDVIPKEEDFVKVPFRLLSATTVAGGTWRSTDFGNEKVLKASMSKLLGKSVFTEHDQSVGNWAGYVASVEWQKGFTQETASGTINVPAGINGELALDYKTNPKLIRSVMSGGIYSNSVTVDFTWEPSHESPDGENEYWFRNNVGEFDSKGEMIRRIVTDIYDYHESSIVWLGADPFSKALTTDGKLRNIDTSSVVSFSKEEDTTQKKYSENKIYQIGFGVDRNLLTLARESLNNRKPDLKPKKEITMKPELTALILSLFGVTTLEEITPEAVASFSALQLTADTAVPVINQSKAFSKFRSLKLSSVADDGELVEADVAEEVETAEAVAGKVEGLTLISKAALQDLNASVKTLKDNQRTENDAAYIQLGKDQEGHIREEAIRLYKASLGTGGINEDVVSLLREAKAEKLPSLLKSFVKGATESFGGRCNKCGSEDFSFRSSFTPEGSEDEPDEKEAYSIESVREKYKNYSPSVGKKG